MSVGWPSRPLGEVLRLDLERVAIDPSATYPMVGVLSYGKGLFDREPIEGGASSYKYLYRLKSDHIVMSQLFGWEGALSLCDDVFAKKYVSPQFPTFLCNEGSLDRHYAGWFIRCPSLWQDLGLRTSGMGDRRRTLTPHALLACEVPIPPLEEQRRIVSQIDRLAAKILDARKIRDAAAEELVAFSSSASRAKLDDPSWNRCRLEELCDIITDGTHQTPRYVDEGATFLSAKNVKPFRFIPEAHRKVSWDDFAVYTARNKPRKGDVLLTRVGAGIGEAAVVDQDIEFAIYVSVALIRTDIKWLLPEFLVQWLNSPDGMEQSRGQTLGRGHSQGNLNLNLLRGFSIPVPALEKQRQVLAELDALQAKVGAIKRLQVETSAELNSMVPAILDRAFRGEL